MFINIHKNICNMILGFRYKYDISEHLEFLARYKKLVLSRK